MSPATTATAPEPCPVTMTSAGTPTTKIAATVTAKVENHSLLRTAQPAIATSAPPRLVAPPGLVAAFKAEPDAADRGDVAGRVRVVAQLAAQPGDVHVERLGGGPPLRVPYLAHDLLAGDDLARVAEQDPQQVELLGGQVELGVAVPGAS